MVACRGTVSVWCEFQGVYASAVTPRGKQGEVDYGAAFELMRTLSTKVGRPGSCCSAPRANTRPLPRPSAPAWFICRSSGAAFRFSRARAPRPSDVSVALAREAWDPGAEAVLVPRPNFFQYDQDDLCSFYCQFAAEVPRDTEILLYNIPGAASEISSETAASLLASGRFAGIVHPQTPVGFPAEKVLGADFHTDARAIVSGAACAVPELVTAVQRGGPEAELLSDNLRELLGWAARFPNPTAWKVATALRGLETGGLATPLSARKQRDSSSSGSGSGAGCPP